MLGIDITPLAIRVCTLKELRKASDMPVGAVDLNAGSRHDDHWESNLDAWKTSLEVLQNASNNALIIASF
jgi:hypothetical protein